MFHVSSVTITEKAEQYKDNSENPEMLFHNMEFVSLQFLP